jgi:hypothetical protein
VRPNRNRSPSNFTSIMVNSQVHFWLWRWCAKSRARPRWSATASPHRVRSRRLWRSPRRRRHAYDGFEGFRRSRDRRRRHDNGRTASRRRRSAEEARGVPRLPAFARIAVEAGLGRGVPVAAIVPSRMFSHCRSVNCRACFTVESHAPRASGLFRSTAFPFLAASCARNSAFSAWRRSIWRRKGDMPRACGPIKRRSTELFTPRRQARCVHLAVSGRA